MAGFAFLVTVAFWPGWAGAATTTRWAVITGIVVWLLVSMRLRLVLTVPHLALYTFLLWSAASYSWSPDPLGGVLALTHLLLIVALFCAGTGLTDLRPLYRGAAFGIGVSSLVSLAQLAGWKGVAQLTMPAGLFVNGNFMAEAAVLVMVGLIAERMYWFLPLVAPAALLPGARGPLLALVIALTVFVRNRYIAAIVVAGLVGAAVFSIATGYRIASVTQRLDMWRDTLDGLSWFGRGIGSFYLLYPSVASRTNTLLERPDHAHNDGLEIVFEAGLGALLLVPVLFALCRYAGRTSAGVVLVAFAVESMVEFPLHLPATAFVGALVAGSACRHAPVVRFSFAGVRGVIRRRRYASQFRYPRMGSRNLPV